ncbi:Ig-like domain repeat protein [Streptomyces sp. NPDC005017]|uniref:Ig-like domain repeat protein n=1 Tax=Streptomyces sp. NPDC005017 TaxID=3364706 RepID=UPI0036C55278
MTALAVLFSSAALTVVTAGSASAASVVIKMPGGIVVDGVHRRVFFGDKLTGRIVAADYSGTVLWDAWGLPGVFDLAVSADGETLYAARRDHLAQEILELDADTLAVRARHSIDLGSNVRKIVFAGGKLWFSYQTTGANNFIQGDLGSIDPTAETEALRLEQLPESVRPYYNGGLLDANPGAPNLLALGDSGNSDGGARVLDVTGGLPRLVAQSGSGNFFGDIDLVPGADEVLASGLYKWAYADGQLTEQAVLPGPAFSGDVAPNGAIAQAYDHSVSIFKPGDVKPVRVFTLSTPVEQEVAWAGDSSRVFALAHGESGYTLRVLTNPTLSVPALTVNAPDTATRAKLLTVSGKVTATVQLPAGAQLTVVRTDLENPDGKTLPAVTVTADGTYSFSDAPLSGGTVTYRVSYAGDAEHTTASAYDKVSVSRATPTLTLNNHGRIYSYGADVAFTAHLGTTYKNRTVELWADPFGTDRPKRLIRSGTVNSSGNISATVDMARDTTLYAVFKGDSRYAPRTVAVTAYARVRVSTAVSRHYKTGRTGSGSTTYYWFRKNTDPLLTTTMTYYPGRRQRFDLQVYSQGAWHTLDSQYFTLGTTGRSAVTLGAPGEAGIRARMRSAYVNGGSGDTVNSTTYGAWKYLYFTN